MQSHITVEELCRKLKPVFGKKIDLLYLNYSVADSKEKRLEIEQALNALYHKYLNKSMFTEMILLEPPTSDIVSGDYPFGKVVYADSEICTFGLREKDWQRHICISGMSGSGKTTFAFQILGNLMMRSKPFIVFDWKRSFRPLMKVDDSVLCFTVGNQNVANYFRININQPPKGVHPKEWLNILCDMITETFFASYGVHKILLETLDKAFKDFGVYGGSENYPTWSQIKDRLEQREADYSKRSGGRESEWLTSALRIAYALTFGGFGDVVNYKGEYSMTVEDLLDKKVIFELDSLNNSEKRFFCQFLLTYIYKYKKANLQESRDFKNAIIVDEAHNIFLKERPNFLKESILDIIYREIREYGISLVCLDQHISKLSDVVAGNSACNIAFQQMLPEDVDKVAGIMQLREHRKFFSMLPVGYAIVKLAERYHSPFMMKAPFIEIKKYLVDDISIKDRMKGYVKQDTRMKVFRDSCRPDRLQARIANTDLMMKASGVDTGITAVEDVLAANAEYNSKSAKKREGMYNYKKIVVNHIQEFLYDYTIKQLDSGFSLEQINAMLLKEGYANQDIDIAITNAKRRMAKQMIEKNFSMKPSAAPAKNPGNHPEKKIPSMSISESAMNPAHLGLLSMIQQNPGMGTAELYKSLKLSGRQGSKLRNELLGMGLISVIEDRNEEGWRKRVTLTDEGSSFIAEKEVIVS